MVHLCIHIALTFFQWVSCGCCVIIWFGQSAENERNEHEAETPSPVLSVEHQSFLMIEVSAAQRGNLCGRDQKKGKVVGKYRDA